MKKALHFFIFACLFGVSIDVAAFGLVDLVFSETSPDDTPEFPDIEAEPFLDEAIFIEPDDFPESENNLPIASGKHSRPASLSLQGGGGDDASHVEISFGKELGIFDFIINFCSNEATVQRRRSYKETYYTYRYYTYHHSYWWGGGWSYTRAIPVRHRVTRYYYEDTKLKSMYGEAALLCNPWRGCFFAPYVGAGLRWQDLDDDGYSEDDCTLIGFIGAKLNFTRFYVKGEGSFGEDAFGNNATEIQYGVGCDLSSSIGMELYGKKLDFGGENRNIYGAKLTYYF